jgi:hypothetical protein
MRYLRKNFFLFLALLITTSVSSGTLEEYLRHPAGLEFQYPSEWNAKEGSFGDVELTPPDQSMSANGATEAYFICGLGLDPAKSMEEQVEEQLKELIGGIAPFLKASEGPESFLGKKVQGFVYTYEGKRSDGYDVISRIFVLPGKDVAFALVSLGLRENVVKREPSLGEIFGTFALKKLPIDSSLPGFWMTSQNQISTQTQEGSSAEHNEIQLESDGTFVTLIQSPETEGMKNTLNTGRWYSRGNRLYFVSAGNLGLIFRFQLEGEPGTRKLTLIHSNGSQQEFHEFKSEPNQ